MNRIQDMGKTSSSRDRDYDEFLEQNFTGARSQTILEAVRLFGFWSTLPVHLHNAARMYARGRD